MAMVAAFSLIATYANGATALALGEAKTIRVLGQYPVLPGLHSTADLQSAIHTHPAMYAQATSLLGLSKAQSSVLVSRIDAGDVKWVVIPRHLERMTWSVNGRAGVVDNVIIPPKSYGWEIDVRGPNNIAEVYIPQACGNFSILHRKLPQQISFVPVPTPRPVPATPTPVATATPIPVTPPPASTIVTPHKQPFAIPLILFGLLAGLLGGGGSSTGGLPPPPPCF